MPRFVVPEDVRAGAAAVALCACVALVACSNDTRSKPAASTAQAPGAAHRTTDSSAGAIELRSEPYHAGPVANGGTITGTISLAGAPRVDTLTPTVDERVCGTTARGPVSATASGLTDALVWITDVKTGKSLPAERRLDLASEDCALDPRVQAAVTGSTVDVINDDAVVHRLVFLRHGSRDTIATMPFFTAGQLVASERLAKQSGFVEIRCARHPWTHGYIAVFDHPYFAVTGASGAFTIDSLPAGTYTLAVWHEGMITPVQRTIQVPAGAQTKADVALQLDVNARSTTIAVNKSAK